MKLKALELGTGRAIAIGPHIPIQCAEPKNPTANAEKIIGDISSQKNFIQYEKKFHHNNPDHHTAILILRARNLS